MKPFYEDDAVTIYHGDALEVLPQIDAADLILTDPPYFRVKNLEWDRQWGDAAAFLGWLDRSLVEFERIMAANGSLYLFASPQMAARVEVLIGQRFNVLSSIIWGKTDEPTSALRYGADRFRQYVPKSERVIFAEHFSANNMAKGEAGYVAKCDELRGFVFEPLRAYLAGERDRSGVDNSEINAAWCEWKGVGSTSQTQKWFSNSCFNPPTEEAYVWLRGLMNRNGGEHLRREYEDLRREYEDLRREYEDLRREYEDLRRPFTVTAQDQFADVWAFPTVKPYRGKHPCEKPQAMLHHIIEASSRPGAMVLDPFMGSGSALVAAAALGRRAIGIEKDEVWCERAAKHFDQAALDFGEAA